MIEFIKTNTLFLILGLFVVKYLIQFYYIILNKNQKIKFKEQPFVSSKVIWLIALVIFAIFIFRYDNQFNLFGLIILTFGIIIGILGLIYLNKNFHNDLVVYDSSVLVKSGIYSIVRHPIRVGICLETLALVVFANSLCAIPLFLIYIYYNYKRTIKEEEFLITVYGEETIEYFIDVPRFNVIKGLLMRLKICPNTWKCSQIWLNQIFCKSGNLNKKKLHEYLATIKVRNIKFKKF